MRALPQSGFTLIEAMISAAVLGLVAAAAFGTFAAGLKVERDLADAEVVASLLRSRMELLLAAVPSALTSGTQTVTHGGVAYTVKWQVSGIDLDGDAVDETAARQIDVTVGDASLTTIVVDNMGRLRKI